MLTGKVGIDRAIIALVLLTSLAIVGVFVFTEIIYQKPLPSDAQEKKDLKNSAHQFAVANAESFNIEKLTANILPTGNRLRFVDIKPHILPFKPHMVKILESNKAAIYDIFFKVSSKMAYEELSSISGRIIYENRIKTEINDFFGKPVVKEIYFSHFVVQ